VTGEGSTSREEGVVPRPPRRRLARLAPPAVIGVLLFITVLSGYLLSYNVDKPTHNADWYVRYQVTCKIVEGNTFAITPYRDDGRTGPGLGGHKYAQYTLGQTVAMIPLYLFGRALAGVSHTNCDAVIQQPIVFLTAKSLDLILGALLSVLFFATARLLGYARAPALALTLLLAFGTSLWPDVLSSEEHTLESLFLLAAAYAALRYTLQRRKNRLWLFVMGLAAGLVFVTRVAGVIALPIFALHLVTLHWRGPSPAWMRPGRWASRGPWARRPRALESATPLPLARTQGAPFDGTPRGTAEGPTGAGRLEAGAPSGYGSPHRETSDEPRGAGRSASLRASIAWRPFARDLAIYAAGVLPSLLVNAAYDTIRFGKPWQMQPKPDESVGYPPWFGLPNLLISPGKGLIWYTPALFLLLLAARPFWRRFPRPAILFGLIGGVYLLFYANVKYWHGDPAWGPRYLYALLPYLILPLGEVWRRWRGYRLSLRALAVGVLAASFLVQFSAVTVSYWRHWDYIYGYHYDQVEDHAWGQNLNYWWSPDQSPIVISLAGIADITQKYVDHAPLVQHTAYDRLSNPYESSIYAVYGEAAIFLTNLDDLHYSGNWNTFTPWWMHVYPWWNAATVMRVALGLAAVFVVAGGLLLVLIARREGGARALRAPPDAMSDKPGRAIPFAPGGEGNGHRGNGHGYPNGNGNGNRNGLPLEIAALSRLTVPLLTLPSGSGIGVPGASGASGAVAVAAPPAPAVAVVTTTAPPRPVGGLLPLGAAALLATLVYGGIVDVAALRAPRQAPPLVRAVPMSATVRDGSWSYRVLSVTSVPGLPGGIAPPIDPAHHYVIVRLRLHSSLSRPQHMRVEWFDLTDPSGLRYPCGPSVRDCAILRTQVAQLYHLTPFASEIPPHAAVDGVLVFTVRNTARNLELLGPGIALVRLTQ